MHYKRLRKHGSVDLPPRSDRRAQPCAECGRPIGEHGCRGWCSRCYQSWKRYADPGEMRRRVVERHEKRKGYTKIGGRDGRPRHLAVAEALLGRPLQRGEVVHHIDMDKRNDDSSNVWVYPNRQAHNAGHHSLERLTTALLKRGVIRFEAGRYVMD